MPSKWQLRFVNNIFALCSIPSIFKILTSAYLYFYQRKISKRIGHPNLVKTSGHTKSAELQFPFGSLPLRTSGHLKANGSSSTQVLQRPSKVSLFIKYDKRDMRWLYVDQLSRLGAVCIGHYHSSKSHIICLCVLIDQLRILD